MIDTMNIRGLPDDFSDSYNGTNVKIFAQLYDLVELNKRTGFGTLIDTKYKTVFTEYIELDRVMTVSVSSTITTVPVRVGGQKKAVAYLKNHRTIAGTFVFLDKISNVFDEAMTKFYNKVESLSEEDYFPRKRQKSLWYDEFPKMNIIMIVAPELSNGIGKLIVLRGVSFRDVGVTYSIADLYTEKTMTYVAEDAGLADLEITDKEYIGLGAYKYKYIYKIMSYFDSCQSLEDFFNSCSSSSKKGLYEYFTKTHKLR